MIVTLLHSRKFISPGARVCAIPPVSSGPFLHPSPSLFPSSSQGILTYRYYTASGTHCTHHRYTETRGHSVVDIEALSHSCIWLFLIPVNDMHTHTETSTHHWDGAGARDEKSRIFEGKANTPPWQVPPWWFIHRPVAGVTLVSHYIHVFFRTEKIENIRSYVSMFAYNTLKGSPLLSRESF